MGKYFKYAIGEILLVVIGILIALQINNWNEVRKEKEQIKNILSRVIKDFNSNSKEITFAKGYVNVYIDDIQQITASTLSKDSLLNNNAYFNKYIASFSGFEDIKINRDGVDLLQTKIQNDYNLNNGSIEELLRLYSENYYEVEVDEKELIRNFIRISDYILSTGSHFENDTKNDKSKLVEMVMHDKTFKIYLNEYNYALGLYMDKLESFQEYGKVIIEKIKAEYEL